MRMHRVTSDVRCDYLPYKKRSNYGWRPVIYINKQDYNFVVLNLQPSFIKTVFFVNKKPKEENICL